MDHHSQVLTSPALASRAAEYIRMSTESQTCSPKVQRETIALYAFERGLSVVRSYADEGKSGLTLDGRRGLRSLLADIQRGDHGFSHLLVFDVSRWGRFQDVDESAYYEFLCRKAGVQVAYCAEAFENDSSPYAAVLKSVKRIMAAEYSRDLSNKIYLSQRRHALEGYFQGGSPGYARRRLLIDETGFPRWPMGEGDRKGLRSDRIVLVPGPAREVATVKEIFRLFLEENLNSPAIATRLNAKARFRKPDRPWNGGDVIRILRSLKYAGANVYGRTSRKLKGVRKQNPRSAWAVAPEAFPPIVSPAICAAAEAKFRRLTRNQTDDEVLDALRKLWMREGELT